MWRFTCFRRNPLITPDTISVASSVSTLDLNPNLQYSPVLNRTPGIQKEPDGDIIILKYVSQRRYVQSISQYIRLQSFLYLVMCYKCINLTYDSLHRPITYAQLFYKYS